jgi:hypothetical protein
MAFTTPGTAVAGEVLTAAFWNTNVRDNIAQLANGYTLSQTVYFTASGTFTKATYPWLRALKVRVQGGGGGAGGTASTNSIERAFSGHGGGGGYAEKFIIDIAGLSASETITVGAGGAAGSAGANAGGTGGTSTAFGVSATGGTGGAGAAAVSGSAVFRTGGAGGTGSGGDIAITGGDADHRRADTAPVSGHLSGSAVLGSAAAASSAFENVSPAAHLYGGGAPGINSLTSQAAKAGTAGAAGIVIVELYA